MITFKQYLAEGRSGAIDVDSAIKWMQNNAMKYLDAGEFLYRGNKDVKNNAYILYADSRAGKPRQSIGGMANYYTWWMSYNPKWKGLPRREHSFITTNAINVASVWGRVYIIIPSDDSKIGAIGSNDIWNRDIPNSDLLPISRFVRSTRAILEVLEKDKIEDYLELEKSLKSVELADVLRRTEERDHEFTYLLDNAFISFIKTNESAKTLFDLWDIVFDPKNFKFMDTGSIKGNGDDEFWIEGSAVFIPLENTLDQISTDRLLDWADVHAPNLLKELRKHW